MRSRPRPAGRALSAVILTTSAVRRISRVHRYAIILTKVDKRDGKVGVRIAHRHLLSRCDLGATSVRSRHDFGVISARSPQVSADVVGRVKQLLARDGPAWEAPPLSPRASVCRGQTRRLQVRIWSPSAAASHKSKPRPRVLRCRSSARAPSRAAAETTSGASSSASCIVTNSAQSSDTSSGPRASNAPFP